MIIKQLKPCPFCGSDALVKGVYVECPNCFVKTIRFLTSNDAIKAWNRRYGEKE